MNTMSTIPSQSPSMRSPWHSPVPYLFGGLAAMLGLIAFALLILACSYWRLSKHIGNNGENSTDRDLEAGSDEKPKCLPQFKENVLVIMAGQNTPTFLAAPVSSKVSSFTSSTCRGDEASIKLDGEGEGKVTVQDIDRHETST